MTRKCFLLVLLALAWTPFTAAEPRSSSAQLVAAVDSIGIAVGEMDRALAFYRDVLAFEPQSDEILTAEEAEQSYGVMVGKTRRVRLKLGDESIVLTQFLERKGRSIPADSRSNDHWFQHIAIITTDMEFAYQRLRELQVDGISETPQRLPDSNPASGGVQAYYFRDPDGHPLEILQFPPDKGQRKWHRPTERLFLGIDHTAIVVSDTECSLAFYQDLLGMKVVGKSLNFGPEQERLNNVPQARLRITSLRAESGPGVELLEYQHPTYGREAAADTNVSDLVHWLTNMTTVSLPETAARLKESGATIQTQTRGGISVLDPDRHAVRFFLR
ncbi:MAG: VOC family protein [Planctomycetaceae bacterium]|nr:VOC family protein [Planctomycetaceae bacterium]